MCNLYNLTSGPQAIREFTRAVLDEVGNLEPGKINPDYSAPIVRNGDGSKRKLVRARWGMPTPPKFLEGKKVDKGVTNVRNASSPHWRRWLDIPKSDGKMRPLGIPTVADRIAQMVVKRHLEPTVEPKFHQDSYGYRPGKSALDAIGVARQRSGTDVQFVHPRLDQLLWSVLSFCSPTYALEHRTILGSMGFGKVQILAWAQTAIPALAFAHRAAPTSAVRPLASASWTWPNNGSRMMREYHVRF